MSDKPGFPPLPSGLGVFCIGSHSANKETTRLGPLTARELLQKLQALDERTLDMPIYVQQVNGEYDCIKDVLVEHPGPSHAKNVTIIHLDGQTEE